MFSGAIAMMLLSQAHTLPSILALAALAGLTGEMYRPASSALLADLVPAGPPGRNARRTKAADRHQADETCDRNGVENTCSFHRTPLP